MTYSKEVISVTYKADGIAREFMFPFRIFRAEDIVVELDDDVLKDGFSVEGDRVVFKDAPTAGSDILIRRFLDFTRIGSFTAGAPFRAEDLNRELDYTRACLRQVFEMDLKEAVAYVEDAVKSVELIYDELTGMIGRSADYGWINEVGTP